MRLNEPLQMRDLLRIVPGHQGFKMIDDGRHVIGVLGNEEHGDISLRGLGNDGSEGAKKALKTAIQTARQFNAELHTISVEEHLPHYAATVGEVLEAKEEKNGYFKKINEEAKEMAAKEGVILHAEVIPGHEVKTIVNHAKDNHFDLVVIGFMGHSKIYGRVWGSTSQNITRLVPCTVMVVK